MSYSKNTWNNGDVITKTKLDNIENGIYNNAVTQVAVNNGVASFKNADNTELFTLNLPTVPTPPNMIANGDFSAAGATTDGWYALNPRSSIAITDGKLVLTHNETGTGRYSIVYDVNLTAGHTYIMFFKFKKTLADTSNSRVVDIRFGGLDGEIAGHFQGLAVNDVIENATAYIPTADCTNIVFMFGGNIALTASNDSMLELYYVKMYDITDIISGW